MVKLLDMTGICLKVLGDGVMVFFELFHKFPTNKNLSNSISLFMTKKEDDNPLEEIQKQLRDLLSNKNVQVAFAPLCKA